MSKLIGSVQFERHIKGFFFRTAIRNLCLQLSMKSTGMTCVRYPKTYGELSHECEQSPIYWLYRDVIRIIYDRFSCIFKWFVHLVPSLILPIHSVNSVGTDIIREQLMPYV